MLQNAPMYAYLPAKDVARARKFYEDKLGFSAADEVAGVVAYDFANGTGCFLYPTSNAGLTAPARRSGGSTTSSVRSRI